MFFWLLVLVQVHIMVIMVLLAIFQQASMALAQTIGIFNHSFVLPKLGPY